MHRLLFGTVRTAIMGSTAVIAFGSASSGEVGLGLESPSGVFTPTAIPSLAAQEVVAVASSGTATSSAALTAKGEVYTWGTGDARLGHGGTGTSNQDTPRLIEALVGKPVVAVAMGEFHGLALVEGGKLYSWGTRATGAPSTSGKKGHLPVQVVEGLGSAPIVSLAAGREHSVVVDAEGKAYVFGVGSTYALGTGTKDAVPKPLRLELPGHFVAAAAGREHTLLLDAAGNVLAAGTNAYGQAGSNAGPYTKTFTPMRGLPSNIVSIAAGEYSSFAVSASGDVYAWGFNKDGGLGTGDRTDSGTPRAVAALAPQALTATLVAAGAPKLANGKTYKVVQVAAGGGHTLFLTDAGFVLAAGRGRSGQLGRGDSLESVASPRLEPVLVTAGALAEAGKASTKAGCISVGAGRDHSLVVVAKGGPGMQ